MDNELKCWDCGGRNDVYEGSLPNRPECSVCGLPIVLSEEPVTLLDPETAGTRAFAAAVGMVTK